MPTNPEHVKPLGAARENEPQVVYSELADRIENAVEASIRGNSEFGEHTGNEVNQAIDATPGLALLRRLRDEHNNWAGWAGAIGRDYRPNPNLLDAQRPFIEVMTAQADELTARNHYVTNGADAYLRSRLEESLPPDADDILNHTLRQLSLPPDTTRTEFDQFTAQVAECLKEYLNFLKPNGNQDYLDRWNLPFGDLGEIRDVAQLTPELHDLLVERGHIRQTMFEILSEYCRNMQHADGGAKAEADQTARTEAARAALDAVPAASDKPETLTPEQQIIKDDVLRAGRATTLVSTDMVGKVELAAVPELADSRTRETNAGFQSFGHLAAHWAVGNAVRKQALDTYQRQLQGRPKPVEAVLFTPAIERKFETRTVEEAVRGIFGYRKPNTRQETVELAPEEIRVTNPITGQKEPGVYVDYHFGPDMPQQIIYPAADGRAGNYLLARILLPKSTADRLEKAVRDDPAVMRTIARDSLLVNGGLPQEYWDGLLLKHGPVRVKPPYEELPDDWKIAVLAPGEDWQELPVRRQAA